MLEHINKAQKKLKDSGVDCFLFTSLSNVFYLSGFSSSNGYVILFEDEGYYITDGRYYENAKIKVKGLKVLLISKDKKLKDIFLEIFSDKKVKCVGFEKDKITLSSYEKLKEDLSDYTLLGYTGFLDKIRMVKTEEEINIIKEATEKTDRIFVKLIENIKSFDTEISIRRKIVDLIFEENGSSESFPSIVATGKNSAIPHWETSFQKIEYNAPLLIDMGMRFRGYCSDFTRTIFLGKVDTKLEKIYNVVKEAHLEAVSIVKPGIKIKDIDKKARSIIERYGYGEYFIHSTGHGIGIDIHEEPRIYQDNDEELLENTVFTVEPGIYIPNLGGVRLENIVVARKSGAEVLTKIPLDILNL